MTIGILNIGIGNVGSLHSIAYNLGFEPVLINNPEDIDSLSHLIVPGVSAFSGIMKAILENRLNEKIHSHFEQGKPILGICIGMQIFSKAGQEGGETEGFGFFNGVTIKNSELDVARDLHVGWNNVNFQTPHPLFEDISNNCDFYFVHSYHVELEDRNQILGTTEYGAEFCSIAGHKNAVGLQFHPEKSQSNGLKLLENFFNWDGKC